MTKLVISAHPSSVSFTQSIAQIFTDMWEKVVNLYTPRYQQQYLSFEDVLVQEDSDGKISMMQQKITQADEIVLIFPVWWGSFPAVLKNFLDTNLAYGFAFTYNDDGEIFPWLTWKKLSVFCTCNSPGERYEDVLRQYIETHFTECCGMQIQNFYIFDDMRRKNTQEKNIILQNMQKLYD